MAQSEVQSGIPQQVFDREFARATMDQILATPTLLSQMKTLYESPHASRFPLTRATRLLTTPQRVAVNAVSARDIGAYLSTRRDRAHAVGTFMSLLGKELYSSLMAVYQLLCGFN